MEPSAAAPKRAATASSSVGELIVRGDRLHGKRCPLKVPVTFIGRTKGCDLRLNIDGVEPLHCVLAFGPVGLLVRDLNSPGGTQVNGQRVAHKALKTGDVLTVGPVELEVRLPEAPPPASATSSPAQERQALRVQAAAVAAQQLALHEEEARLLQRKGALEQQEEQLAAHLDEKRKRLQALSDRAQAERTALENDRTAWEQFLEKVSGDLTPVQRELIDSQQQIQNERRRLVALVKKLKLRFKKQWQNERARLKLREEELADEDCNLARERDALNQKAQALLHDRLRFQGDYELGKRQLLDAWARLRRAQRRWRTRRGQERAALALRAREVENAEVALGQAQQSLRLSQERWLLQRGALEREIKGLNQRCKNQRVKIREQEDELQRLKLALPPGSAVPPASPPAAVPPADAPATAAATANAKEAKPASEEAEFFYERLEELERLAGELADQRQHLAEQWQRLAQAQDHWHRQQTHAAAEIESVITRAAQQRDSLKQREDAQTQTENHLRDRHQELVQLHQQLVGWRARLHTRENAFEGERTRLLAELKHREELAETHLNALVEVRQRWARRRKQDLDQLRQERADWDKARQELRQRSQELARRQTALEAQKRQLTEKNLVLEQFRKEFLGRSGDAASAERRIERLRRRWLTQNATQLRNVAAERQALSEELSALEARYAELDKRQETVVAAETALAEKLAAWEHKQVLANARIARMQQEAQAARSQQVATEQELARMKEEVERIARNLLDEPELPAALKAA